MKNLQVGFRGLN